MPSWDALQMESGAKLSTAEHSWCMFEISRTRLGNVNHLVLKKFLAEVASTFPHLRTFSS